MNDTLYIDPETGDLEFDEDGDFRMIGGGETTAQNVRLTLQTHKESFPLDLSHGAHYDRFLGVKGVAKGVIDETIREAVYQETDVVEVDSLEAVLGGKRNVDVHFRGRLGSGRQISMEVSA
ncbi:MAG: hypothetical protein LBB75_02085 [Oscillospiraceae bacterium]|jgi:hypothetical protein|nr:hypothetical protein [Oscillospiraceae bacterium]